jgi:hypothetical protein
MAVGLLSIKQALKPLSLSLLMHVILERGMILSKGSEILEKLCTYPEKTWNELPKTNIRVPQKLSQIFTGVYCLDAPNISAITSTKDFQTPEYVTITFSDMNVHFAVKQTVAAEFRQGSALMPIFKDTLRRITPT